MTNKETIENTEGTIVKKKNLFNKILDIFYKIFPYIAGLVVPVMNFYLLQTYINYDIKTHALALLNIIFFELLAWFLILITNRVPVGLLIETAFVFVFGLTEYFVVQFRTTPILPWDIFSIGTAMNVAGAYEFTLKPEAKKTTIYFVEILVVLIALVVIYRKEKVFKKLKARLIVAAVSLIALGGYSVSLQSDTIMEKADYYKYQYTPLTMMRKNGIAATLLYDVKYMSVKAPDGYSEEDAEQTLEEYAEDDTEESTEDLPNVIAIMNETWSDLNVLGEDFTTNQEVMPFIDSLREGADNTISGNCHVSIVGGNTANSEYEFITGNTMKFMPDGSIPYMSYIKKSTPSLFSHMESLGYNTFFLHPNYPRGWNREKVYNYFGVDNIRFGDLDGNDDVISPVVKMRNYTTDQFVFERIESLFEDKEDDDPIFTWTVTIQNHGGYTTDSDDFESYISVGNESSKALNTYLTLMNITDQAFEELVDYFKDYDEKTIIVMFGDHQPNDNVVEPIYSQNGKSVSDLTPEETELRYITPYVIWANYDIDEATDVDTSANYLAAQTLQAAGIPTSDYQNYLLDLAADVPVLSNASVEDPEGNDIDESTISDKLEEYRKLAYYRLFDCKVEK